MHEPSPKALSQPPLAQNNNLAASGRMMLAMDHTGFGVASNGRDPYADQHSSKSSAFTRPSIEQKSKSQGTMLGAGIHIMRNVNNAS